MSSATTSPNRLVTSRNRRSGRSSRAGASRGLRVLRSRQNSAAAGRPWGPVDGLRPHGDYTAPLEGQQGVSPRAPPAREPLRPAAGRRRRPRHESSTVEAGPPGVGPPSRTRSTRSPRPAITSSAVRGLAAPWGFALGAVTGSPRAATKRAGDRVTGQSDADRPRPRRERRGQVGVRVQHERQRSRPVSRHQPARPGGHLPRDPVDHREGVDQHEQGLVRRPALRLEDPRDRRGVERAGPEPVEGLGRERDERAAPEDAGRRLERRRGRTARVDDEPRRAAHGDPPVLSRCGPRGAGGPDGRCRAGSARRRSGSPPPPHRRRPPRPGCRRRGPSRPGHARPRSSAGRRATRCRRGRP